MNKLLIVDDNQQNLYLLETLLKAKGFQVELASNGVEALELARKAPPEMIISDILMPVMDGFSLCRAWKGDEGLKQIPFIFYTATYTNPQDEDFALSLGAERFIVKPVKPNDFLAILQGVFQTQESGGLVAPQAPIEEEAEYYKEYNETLIRKLEDKLLKLEEANQALVIEIEQRRQAEQALKEAHDNLEERFEERTHDLNTLVGAMAGREVRMADLKKVIKKLRAQLIAAGMEPVADDPLNEWAKTPHPR